MDNKKTYIVEKRNVLNSQLKTYEDFTLSELRLFLIYLSKINPRDESSRYVRLPLAEFADMVGIQVNRKDLKKLGRRLLQHIVTVPRARGCGYDMFQIFSEVSVLKDDDSGLWYFQMNAHDNALPLMFNFKEEYVTYPVENILKLKSSTQIRLYELLKQFEPIGKLTITIQELRKQLGVKSNESVEWSYFRRDILEPAVKALEANTDIRCSYSKGASGAGGKWLSVVFRIEANDRTRVSASGTAKKTSPDSIASNDGTERIAKLLGISRKLGKNQAEFVRQWIEAGYSDELILSAKEISIRQKDHILFHYMNGILKNISAKSWQDKPAADNREADDSHAQEKAAIRNLEKFLESLNATGGESG